MMRQDERIIDSIRPMTPLYRESSLAAALDMLRQTNADIIPVVDGSMLVGVLWAQDAREALLADVPLSTPLSNFIDSSPPAIASTATRERAREALSGSGRPSLVVIDPDGRYLGILRVLDLHYAPSQLARPPMVGGMATPLGVYLTNGSLVGGVKAYALLLTGMAMSAMLLVGVVVTTLVYDALPLGAPSWLYSGVANLLPVALFFLQVRLSPIAATHGAEHMVVHAIERGEALRPDIVKRMPRIHPRCGTNLAIGALLFTSLVQLMWPSLHASGALVALLVTLALWRPLGNFAQQYVTTKTPRDKDINSAISAAEELLAKYRSSERRAPTVGARLAASGLPLIIIGSMIVMALAPYIISFLGLGEQTLQLL